MIHFSAVPAKAPAGAVAAAVRLGPSLLIVLLLATSMASAQSVLRSDSLDDGMQQWVPFAPDYAVIVDEPGTDNRVLQLTPQKRAFSYVLLRDSEDYADVRMQGRFLFPTEGDGYLGFLYNYQKSEQRVDFGCIYVKSNGSYLRMSPHYDGNPSWRLHEEAKVPLEGERRIEVGRWYEFRLDVRGHHAQLYIDDMTTPLASFGLFDQDRGALGLEARPGGGEPVWVDDIVVSRLAGAATGTASSLPSAPPGALDGWEILGPVVPPVGEAAAYPDLPEEGWREFNADARGALITGSVTQFSSGDLDTLYLRSYFDAGDEARAGWLAFSSANRLDVWLNGYYRGTVAADRYIWSDYLTAPEHPGAQLPMAPSPGRNEVLVRVHGRRFAGGGFFADLRYPE